MPNNDRVRSPALGLSVSRARFDCQRTCALFPECGSAGLSRPVPLKDVCCKIRPLAGLPPHLVTPHPRTISSPVKQIMHNYIHLLERLGALLLQSWKSRAHLKLVHRREISFAQTQASVIYPAICRP